MILLTASYISPLTIILSSLAILSLMNLCSARLDSDGLACGAGGDEGGEDSCCAPEVIVKIDKLHDFRKEEGTKLVA